MIRQFSSNSKPEDTYFSKMYFPNISMFNGNITFSFQSQANYDLEISLSFNANGSFKEGGVTHLTNEWSYALESATEIRGFEDNKSEFDSLRSITELVVKENLQLINDILSKPRTLECEGDKYFDFSSVGEKINAKLTKTF